MTARTTLRRHRLLRMVLAVLLTLLSVQLLGAERARAEAVTDGNYYASSPPTSGCLDAVSNRLVALQDSKLFNGNTTDCVGWEGASGAPKSVTLAFDLLYDRPLSSISITSTAKNTFWGFDEIEVTYRPEAGTAYRVAHSEAWDRSRLDYQRTVAMNNAQARFVRIKLTRVNQFLHFPLSEVTFTVGSGTVDPTPDPYTEAEMAAEVSLPTRLVDIYGQYLYGTWSGKLTSDQQLQQDGTDEATALADVTLDTTTYDQYGGVKALGRSTTHTGFFRLERDTQGKWWFITPDDYKFILKGVDSTSATDWGYATVVKDTAGNPLGKFSALPDEASYAAAYSSDRKEMSFVEANLMRKYDGTGWETPWRDITKKRLIKWGFNAQSKWSRDGGLQMPWIGQITAPANVKRISSYAIDPFDPAFATELDKQLSPTTSIVRANVNSPWLIGYFFDNERGWDDSAMTTMLKATPTQYPAKAAFVDYMFDTYGLSETNNKLGTPGATQQDLEARDLSGNVPVGSSLRAEFIGEASKAYYSTVRAAIRKYDPNHLFLGSALVPGWRSTLAWEVCGREYVDAISLDVYSNSADYLDTYEPYDKPVLNLEHSFNVHGQGLRSINGSVRADDIADRGTMHQEFSWAQANSPVFVGSGWFSYYDQAITGRASDGENFNFGLVNQQDQPYTAMTDVMTQTHQGLEQRHKDAPLPTTGTQSVCPD